MIGLLDYDAIMSGKIDVPNLDLMKMSSYLRKKKLSHRLILTPDEIESCAKVIVFQNSDEYGYPSRTLRRSGTEWYGLAYTNGVYKPMAPEIEACEPSIGIYKTLFKKYLLDETMSEAEISYLLNATYMRLSLPLNKKYVRQVRPGRRVFVYDTEAFVGDWEKNVDFLLRKKIRGFILLHRQIVTDLEVWRKILLHYPRETFYRSPITLSFTFTDGAIDTIIDVYKKATNGVNTFDSTNGFHIYPSIALPYKENTKKFVEAIGEQLRSGYIIRWKIADYNGNPFHPFINALSRWAGQSTCTRMTFLEYLLKHDLHRELRFARALMAEGYKFTQIFTTTLQVAYEAQGGLRKYDTSGNSGSSFRDFL